MGPLRLSVLVVALFGVFWPVLRFATAASVCALPAADATGSEGRSGKRLTHSAQKVVNKSQARLKCLLLKPLCHPLPQTHVQSHVASSRVRGTPRAHTRTRTPRCADAAFWDRAVRHRLLKLLSRDSYRVSSSSSSALPFLSFISPASWSRPRAVAVRHRPRGLRAGWALPPLALGAPCAEGRRERR